MTQVAFCCCSFHCGGEQILYDSVHLNLLRFGLWANIWSVFYYLQYVLDKNVYSAYFGWSVLEMSLPLFMKVIFIGYTFLDIKSSYHYFQFQFIPRRFFLSTPIPCLYVSCSTVRTLASSNINIFTHLLNLIIHLK